MRQQQEPYQFIEFTSKISIWFCLAFHHFLFSEVSEKIILKDAVTDKRRFLITRAQFKTFEQQNNNIVLNSWMDATFLFFPSFKSLTVPELHLFSIYLFLIHTWFSAQRWRRSDADKTCKRNPGRSLVCHLWYCWENVIGEGKLKIQGKSWSSTSSESKSRFQTVYESGQSYMSYTQ